MTVGRGLVGFNTLEAVLPLIGPSPPLFFMGNMWRCVPSIAGGGMSGLAPTEAFSPGMKGRGGELSMKNQKKTIT